MFDNVLCRREAFEKYPTHLHATQNAQTLCCALKVSRIVHGSIMTASESILLVGLSGLFRTCVLELVEDCCGHVEIAVY